jgi:hypothetical protein
VKAGDLVKDVAYDFYFNIGLVLTEPRLSDDCDAKQIGEMDGDAYYVVEVLCDNCEVKLFTTDELRVVSESR